MAEKKQIAFALLKILQEETDENHIMPAGVLMDKLNRQLNLDIERRTLYANIELLRQAGYEVSDYADNRKGYYLAGRQFEKGEVLLLCNAIHASHFIDQKQSSELIDKLLKTLSVHQQKEFRESVYMPNRLKTDSKSLFYNIEIISEAIRDRKTLQFTYMHYNSRKRLTPKRAEPYIVEPRYIVYQDSRPYLICTNPRYSNFIHYRIDKIKDPVILEEQVRSLTRAGETEAYRYAENKLFMFAGDVIPVTYKCQDRIMDQMIDIFGTSLKVQQGEDGYFFAHIRTTENGALFLAQQFLDAIEIVDPQNVKEKMKERLRAIQ